MTEFERQKKCLLNQIALLKADNLNLTNTICEMHAIVEEFDNSFKAHFENSLHSYIVTPTNDTIKEEVMIEGSDFVPFARTFSHSIEEINLIKAV